MVSFGWNEPNEGEEDMFRISDFSRLARVSVKTLRHYDRLGLLVPAYVDPASRYRWYTARQVSRLQRILSLRELGFSLEHVAGILEEDPRGRTVRRLLELKREDIGRQLETGRQRLAQLEARLRESEPVEPRLPDAVLQPLPPIRVASRRARVADLDRGAQELFEKVEADAMRTGIRATGPPLLLYHDRSFRESGADLEAMVPVTHEARSAGGSTLRTLPFVPAAACLVYSGGYEQWAEVARGLMAWLQTRRLVPVGPLREVFLQFQSDGGTLELPRQFLVEHPGELVTEMQIPVRASEARRVRAPRVQLARRSSRPSRRPIRRGVR
jgi:DNA-binding transcriptional MerR regulator